MFWQQYRRTFIPVHLLILAVCLIFVMAGGAPWESLIRPVLVLEMAALFGARMAARFKVAVDRANDTASTATVGK